MDVKTLRDCVQKLERTCDGTQACEIFSRFITNIPKPLTQTRKYSEYEHWDFHSDKYHKPFRETLCGDGLQPEIYCNLKFQLLIQFLLIYSLRAGSPCSWGIWVREPYTEKKEIVKH
jgi:hypothetical protein